MEDRSNLFIDDSPVDVSDLSAEQVAKRFKELFGKSIEDTIKENNDSEEE